MSRATSTMEVEELVTEAATTPAIEFDSVTKIYRHASGENVLGVENINLSVPRGEFVCLLGPSGHGKTTLLNLVAGFVMPTSGEVKVDGKLVQGPGPDRGVVFQQDTLFLWRKVSENIAFGLKARGIPKNQRQQIVQKYLRIIDLERFANAWPKELSGGMKRRVAIAAVFANDPAVLLMDEPFVGLDYVRRAALHEVLLDLWKHSARRTVFFITHDVEEALALGDRVLVVSNGGIAYDADISLERPRSAKILASDAASTIRLNILSHMGVSPEAVV